MNLSHEETLEQIVAEFTARLRDGETPTIPEYQQKHPGLEQEIDDLLASVAMIEGLKHPAEPTSGVVQRDIDHLMQLERLGDYRIIRQLGRGGMGIVLQAEHVSLGRPVAIKVLPARLVTDEKALERFRREARAAASLHHTNIVGVFGVGQSEGYHYFVMELVRGQPVSQVIRDLKGISTGSDSTHHSLESAPTRFDDNNSDSAGGHDNRGDNGPILAGKPLDPDDTVGLSDTSSFRKSSVTDLSRRELESDDTGFSLNGTAIPVAKIKNHYRWAAGVAAQTADAMTYAHAQGILHRDIKPSNLLLDGRGTVWITDFGLVKNFTNQTMTATGDIIGTPQYMAPESFEGRYDARSETYCLGLTLYEMAALQPAYADATTPEIIRAITSAPPAAIAKVEPSIPRDLATIIDKAIAREPRDRYQSAPDLREDLHAFLEDRPIKARRTSPFEHVWRWSRRNPLVASLLALSALLLAMVAVVASVGYWSTGRAYAQLRDKHEHLLEQQKQTDAARKEMAVQFERAEGNVDLMTEMFDDMFAEIVFRGSPEQNETDRQGVLDFEGFQQLSSVETTVTSRDAEFLESMLVFYRRFAEQNADNEGLRDEAARAYRRVANIYHLIGDYEKAVDAYQQAARAYKRLVAQDPESIERVIHLARTRTELASALIRSGATPGQSHNEHVRALNDLRNHAAASTTAIRLEGARTLISMTAMTPIEITPDTLEQFREGMIMVPGEDLLFDLDGRRLNPGPGSQPPRRRPGQRGNPPRDEIPQDGRAQDGRAQDGRAPDGAPGQEPGRWPGLYPDRGPRPPRLPGFGPGGPRPDDPRMLLDRLAKDKKHIGDAIEMLETVLQEEPGNEEAQLLRAMCYCRDAQIAYSSNDDELSDRSLQVAIFDLERLTRSSPDNLDYQFVLAETCSLPVSDSVEEDVQRLTRAREIIDSLVEKSPGRLEYLQLQAGVNSELGYLHRDAEDLDAALSSFQKANEAFNLVIDETPAIPQLYFRRAVIDLNYFALMMRNGDFKEARQMLRRSRNSFRSLRKNARGREHMIRLIGMYDQLLERVPE